MWGWGKRGKGKSDASACSRAKERKECNNGGEAILKDKLDPLPQESGLSPDTFVVCIQTKFQRDQFQMLESDFLSIDATHNTCQYKGLQFYTLIVRDHWDHGTLCGTFPLWTITLFLLHRCSCHIHAIVKQHGSDSKILSQLGKRVEPRDQAHNHNDQSWPGANKCNQGHLLRLHNTFVLVAHAPHHADALPYGRIPKTLGAHLWMGKNTRPIKIWILVGRDANWSIGSPELHWLSQGELDANHAHVVRLSMNMLIES